MEGPVLKAERREGVGKGASRALRRRGRIPAVVYGSQREPLAIAVEPRALEKLLATEAGENVLFQLEVPGEAAGERRVIVKELQRDSLRDHLLHADFLEVRMDRAIRVDVPVHLKGDAPGVKAGGVLSQQLRELPIECLPGLIPRAFEVDVSGLGIGDSLHVRDIALPEGVEVVLDPDEPVASVTVVVEEVPVAAVAAVAAEAAPAAEGEEAKPAEGEKGTEEASREGGR